MKLKDFLYLFTILIYIIISQFVLVSYEGIFQYIINPLIWLIFLIIGLFLYHKDYHYYQNQKSILYISISSSLLYNVLFYSLGYFSGYANNAYSTTLNGIIINLFSIVFVLILKNYLRNLLIKKYMKMNIIFIIIVTLLLFLSNINIPLIINLLEDKNNIVLVLIKYILPVLSIEVFTSYLNYYGGAINTITYQILIYTPALIIPIVPKYDDIIPALYNFLFPLFTYIVIKNNLRRKDVIPLETEKPSRLIFYFIAIILIIMFSLGTFSVKPSVILSASMEPIIHKGDIIVIKKCDIKDIKTGDIIEYHYEDYDIVHRVIKTLTYSKGIELVVKGDNNIKEDRLRVTSENLVGCYFFKIKYVGYPSYFIYSIFNNNEAPVETGR